TASAGGSHAVRQSRPRPFRTSPSKSRTSSAERRGTMAGAVKRHRFTIDQYHRIGEAGILSEDEPVELIAGEIVVREPIGSRHAGTVNRLNRLWTSRLGQRAWGPMPCPHVLVSGDTATQPDVALLRPR